jgi:hypothetical protein
MTCVCACCLTEIGRVRVWCRRRTLYVGLLTTLSRVRRPIAAPAAPAKDGLPVGVCSEFVSPESVPLVNASPPPAACRMAIRMD